MNKNPVLASFSFTTDNNCLTKQGVGDSVKQALLNPGINTHALAVGRGGGGVGLHRRKGATELEGSQDLPDLPALQLRSRCSLPHDGGLHAQTAVAPAGRPSHEALQTLVPHLAGPGWMVPRIRLINSNACSESRIDLQRPTRETSSLTGRHKQGDPPQPMVGFE